MQDNQQLKTYKGAVAIITGGGGCIGQALAEELAHKGAHAVVLVDRQPAEQVAVRLREKDTEVKVYQVDVRDADEMQRVVEETVEAFGRVDYMFNNAGTIVSGPLDKIELDDFNYVLDVNIRGVVNGVKAAFPVMKEQHSWSAWPTTDRRRRCCLRYFQVCCCWSFHQPSHRGS